MKHGFTLIEITITIIVALLLATLGMMGYHKILEDAQARVCEVNQQALIRSLEIATEFEAGILGKNDWEKCFKYWAQAHDELMAEADWFTRFSCFFVELNTPRHAYADITDEEADAKVIAISKEQNFDYETTLCVKRDKEGKRLKLGINKKYFTPGNVLAPDEVSVGCCEHRVFTDPAELASNHYEVRALGIEGQALGTTRRGVTLKGKRSKIKELAVEVTACVDRCKKKKNRNKKECEKACKADPACY